MKIAVTNKTKKPFSIVKFIIKDSVIILPDDNPQMMIKDWIHLKKIIEKHIRGFEKDTKKRHKMLDEHLRELEKK